MGPAHDYYVYILQCNDGSYFTGITNNMERRLWEHNNYGSYAQTKGANTPVELRYCERYYNAKQAIAWEKQISGWSTSKKETLFRDDWDEIIRLARFTAMQ